MYNAYKVFHIGIEGLKDIVSTRVKVIPSNIALMYVVSEYGFKS